MQCCVDQLTIADFVAVIPIILKPGALQQERANNPLSDFVRYSALPQIYLTVAMKCNNYQC